MIRRLFMVIVWLGIGYLVGFADARQHDRTIVSRTADRFRGIAQDTYERQKGVLRDAAGEMIEAAAEEVRWQSPDRRSTGQEDSLDTRPAEEGPGTSPDPDVRSTGSEPERSENGSTREGSAPPGG